MFVDLLDRLAIASLSYSFSVTENRTLTRNGFSRLPRDVDEDGRLLLACGVKGFFKTLFNKKAKTLLKWSSKTLTLHDKNVIKAKNINFGQMSKNEFLDKTKNKNEKYESKFWKIDIIAFLMKFGTKNKFGARNCNFQSLRGPLNHENWALNNIAMTMMLLTPKTWWHFL